MSAADQLVRISAPHFVAGLIVDAAGRVRHTAPILKWAHGQAWAHVRAYCERKNWTVEILD